MKYALSIALVLVGGCGGSTVADDAASVDAASTVDAASPVDTGRLDTGPDDAATAHDAAMTVDAFRAFGDAGCATAPTFADVDAAIFSTSCSGPINCHGGSSHLYGGSLVLTDPTTYDMLVGVPSSIDATVLRVDPGSPASSLLYRKLIDDLPDDGSLGGPMPSGEAILWHELPSAQIELVRCWIATGAAR